MGADILAIKNVDEFFSKCIYGKIMEIRDFFKKLTEFKLRKNKFC